MNTFGLTSARALNVRLVRPDGSVHSVAPHVRWPRVHNGALVILRKSRLMPIVAINGNVADVVLGSGAPVAEGDEDRVAPMWRTEPAKPAKAPKAKAAAPAAPVTSEPAPASDNAQLRDEIAALRSMVEQLAALAMQTPKSRKRKGA